MSNIVNDFLNIKTDIDLASFLSINLNTLHYYASKYTPSNAYINFSITKKNGGTRIISAPNKQLKYIQSKLKDVLYEIYQPKRISHGFVKKRNIVTNAEVHKNKQCILNIDLKDFFDSITLPRVIGLFKSKPFSFDTQISITLAHLVCNKNKLPQGAPTSPIISNFICRSLDNNLIKLSSKYKILCTRYCDDITFSTKATNFPNSIIYISENKLVLGEELVSIIKNNDFKINNDKLRCQHKYNRQMVTGLVVNEKINILKSKYKNFRAVMHYTYCNDIKEGAIKNNYVTDSGEADINRFIAYLRGTINYYKMILSIYNKKYQNLAIQYNALTGTQTFQIPDNLDSLINNYIFIIEYMNGDDINQGTAFYVRNFGLVTCLHNVCRFSDVDTLKNNIIKTKVYLPNNSKQTYSVSLKSFSEEDDLLVLKFDYFNIQGGFNFAKEQFTHKIGANKYISVGYPGHAEGSTANILYDVRISQERRLMGLNLKIVNQTFYCGASGGPILDQSHNVVGYIDRGTKPGDIEENYSAFCLINDEVLKRLHN